MSKKVQGCYIASNATNKSLTKCDCKSDDNNRNVFISVWGGYHTLEIMLRMTYRESEVFRDDIKRSNLFYIVGPPTRIGNMLYYYYKPTKIGPKGLSLTLKTSTFSIGYRKGKDIVYSDNGEQDELTCVLIAKINPKIICGIDDYIGVATEEYLPDMKCVFDNVCKDVSPTMKDSSWYTVRRVDSCINIILHDLPNILAARRINVREITPLDVIRLMKMGDVPRHFRVYKPDGCTGDRSCYLMNKSVVVNFYCKSDQMRDWYSWQDERANDIVRLEVQQKYRSIVSKMSTVDRLFDSMKDTICSMEWNRKVIDHYYREVVGSGDWYTYGMCIRKIKGWKLQSNHEARMIWVVDKIKECGSVYLAKKSCIGNERLKFNRSLNELRDRGLNGVCIPDEWGLFWIPNIYFEWLEKQDGA